MAGDLLLTGLSGLNAFRNVLNTTGHNIANATTEGYSRQTVELDARNPQLSGGGYIGSGVQSTSISRLYDSFLGAQFRSSSSAVAELESYSGLARQIDNVLADPNVGLNVALQDFFNATQTVADDPTSIPARQVLLTEGEVIANRFNTLNGLFSDLTSQVNNTSQGIVSEINSYANNIALLNEEIVLASGAGGGSSPNDLLDQRDLLIDKLSEKVNVSTNIQEDGSLNVFIGSGQALVLGMGANTLAIQATSDPTVKDVVFEQTSGNLVITKFITGGELGGTLRFRDEILDPSIDNLGQIAIAFSAAVNDLHTNGLDLNGAQGVNFFNQPSVTVTGSGTLGVTFDPATTSNLTGSNYLVAVAAGSYTITRSSDSAIVANNILGAGSITVDGLSFDVSGLANGDSLVVSPPPIRDVATAFSVGITDPREIAAAQPVLSSLTALNAGSGKLSNISVNLNNSASLLGGNDNVTLTYNTANKRYDVTVAGVTAAPASVAYDPATDSGALAQITVAGFGTIEFTLSGVPENSDSIVLSDNIGGIGDNRNANLLADLQTNLTMANGTASFQDTYGQVIADVGRKTQAAESNGLAQSALLTQTMTSRDAISGVSLDEEAANLIRFQQAYQAASQVVLTSRTIFDTLLGAFR